MLHKKELCRTKASGSLKCSREKNLILREKDEFPTTRGLVGKKKRKHANEKRENLRRGWENDAADAKRNLREERRRSHPSLHQER